MRRLFLVVTATIVLAVPASITAALVSSPAGASSAVACKKLSGSIATTFTVTKCSPKVKKGADKSASGSSSSLASGNGTLTWSKSGQTTTVSLSVSSPGQGGCPSGSTEYDVTGSVTGGTSTYTGSGDAVSGRACASPTGSLSLVKKTSLSL